MQNFENFERATAFVYSSTRSHSGGPVPLRYQLQALFGLWLADKAGILSAGSWVDARASETRDAVAHECERGSFDPYTYDAKLLLLCHMAMRERGFASAHLGAFCNEIADAMEGMSVIPRRLAGEALLLESMGETPIGETGRIEAGFPALGGSLLRADSASLREICSSIAALSLFGARALTSRDTASFSVTMPIVLLQKLREYDLTLAASVLRALKYLSVNAREEIEFATEYLICQQQMDGRFGYYARELSEKARLENADLDLYLPVTVSVLWSLIEAWVPGFSLVERRNEAAEPR